MPYLRHPDLPDDQVIEAVESRVPVLEKSGWVVTDEPDPVAPAATPKPESRRRRGSNPTPAPVSAPADPASAGTHEE